MLRRIFAHRLVRILLWIFITLATLLVLLFVWANWSGKRRWAAAKALVESQGETFDYHALLPPTPAEAQNLLAIAPLRGIAEVAGEDEAAGEPGARRKALQALGFSSPKITAPRLEGVVLGEATDFDAWATYLREIKVLDLPSSPLPTAGDVLAALDVKFPILKQVAGEALQRPQAMFTPGLRERALPKMLFAIRVPHYNAAMNLGRALALRARTAVAAGDGPAAARSLVALSSLSRGCKEERFLIGFLVGSTLDAMAMEGLWLGLKQHVFAAAELDHLRSSLEADDNTMALLGAMRGEMAAGVNALEHIQTAAAKGVPDADLGALWVDGPPALTRNITRLVPSGVFDHWKSATVEMEMRHLIQPLKDSGLMQTVQGSDLAQEELQQSSNTLLDPDKIIARLVMPSISPICMTALLCEARRRQALVAIALEQHRLKFGKYPAKLEELVPEHLPILPLDPCGPSPFRYTLLPSGLFSLWSIAVDRKDDSGKVTRDAKGRAKLNKSDYLGDWTWQYEPVK